VRLECRRHALECGCVRVVALNAALSLPRSACEVPVPGHAAVGAAVVVARLWAVALGAECHDVRELQCSAVGETERVVIVRIVAREAAEIAVRVDQPLVEDIELVRRVVFNVGFSAVVTGGARGGERRAVFVRANDDPWRAFGAMDKHRIKIRIPVVARRVQRCAVTSRDLVFAAASRDESDSEGQERYGVRPPPRKFPAR